MVSEMELDRMALMEMKKRGKLESHAVKVQESWKKRVIFFKPKGYMNFSGVGVLASSN